MNTRYSTKLSANVTNHAYEYSVSKKLGSDTVPPGVETARMKPGTTGRIASTSAAIARGFTPFRYV